MTVRTFRSAAVALVLAAAAASPAFAQRVVKIVVPYGPGAVQDTVARTFSQELGQALGASVIVENRPGAGGTVGTQAVAKSTDNNTLVLSAASHMLAGHLYSKLGYDPVKDFTGVAYIGNSGYVIAAPGNLGVNTLADYVKMVKSQPGKLNYASAGNGSATHLGMAYFLAKAGAQMQHVPMKSTGDAVNEVLAGRVQGVVPALVGVMGFKSDARIKLLAYTGAQRSKFLPELPTVAEAGVPGYKFDTWFGLLAPSTMPRSDVDKINAAMNKVLADPAVQQRLVLLGVEGGTMSVDAFQKLLRADDEQAGMLVKASGARIE
ncbi:MAG TPA: tripartite tricarboxylate transporter substrate-binding protein [Ramlibacter sp.]|uniref:tripartite tricarboxylate transporter substrate-binding protein n=1 Tax=Ramlibacter sp. TaxID=1917967 RepID=UPI002ED28EB4